MAKNKQALYLANKTSFGVLKNEIACLEAELQEFSYLFCMSRELVKLTCICRVKRCPMCSKCSRRGCDHYGHSVKVKMSKGRGGKQPICCKIVKGKSTSRKRIDYNETSNEDDVSVQSVTPKVFSTKNKEKKRRSLNKTSSVDDFSVKSRTPKVSSTKKKATKRRIIN